MNIAELLNTIHDFDEQNYEIAKLIFENEEGRKPNMNDPTEMNVVATLEVGIRNARNYLSSHNQSNTLILKQNEVLSCQLCGIIFFSIEELKDHLRYNCSELK